MEAPFISVRIGTVNSCAKMADEFVPGMRYSSRAQELWALLVESFAGWEQRMDEASAAAGLSPVSAWALIQLDPDREISQKELAARLHCNPSTVVDPTDRLEESRLVVRRPRPTDRRINTLAVTAKGRRVRENLLSRLFEPPEAFTRLSAPDQMRFRDAMLAAVGRTKPKNK